MLQHVALHGPARRGSLIRSDVEHIVGEQPRHLAQHRTEYLQRKHTSKWARRLACQQRPLDHSARG